LLPNPVKDKLVELFIAGIVIPGYITAAAGWTGPAFWILADTFTTLGLRHAKSGHAVP